MTASRSTQKIVAARSRKVMKYIASNELSLDKRLPPGFIDTMAASLKMEKGLVKSTLLKERRKCKVALGTKFPHSTIQAFVEANNLDLTSRLPKGTYTVIGQHTGASITQVRGALSAIRKKAKVKVFAPAMTAARAKKKLTACPTNFHEQCIQANLMRNNPNAELAACNTIVKHLLDLPRGGAGLIIGTPTAFCASSAENNQLLQTDNLMVANILDATTDPKIPTSIIVGSGINPEKAALKAHHWATNNTTAHFNITTDVVDRVSFIHHVTKFAERNPFGKVVLMTSGVWKFSAPSKRKWAGHDFNFKSAAEYIVERYPNLHILAMTLGDEGKGHYKYKIKHLYNGA